MGLFNFIKSAGRMLGIGGDATQDESKPAPPPPAAEAREQLARAALASTQAVKDWAVERSQPFRQNGQDWHEIVARGTDVGSGRPIVVMQTIRFAQNRYVRMVGIAAAEQREAALPRFRKVIDSVQME